MYFVQYSYSINLIACSLYHINIEICNLWKPYGFSKMLNSIFSFCSSEGGKKSKTIDLVPSLWGNLATTCTHTYSMWLEHFHEGIGIGSTSTLSRRVTITNLFFWVNILALLLYIVNVPLKNFNDSDLKFPEACLQF